MLLVELCEVIYGNLISELLSFTYLTKIDQLAYKMPALVTEIDLVDLLHCLFTYIQVISPFFQDSTQKSLGHRVNMKRLFHFVHLGYPCLLLQFTEHSILLDSCQEQLGLDHFAP